VSDSDTPTKRSYARNPSGPTHSKPNCDGKHDIYIMSVQRDEEYVDAGLNEDEAEHQVEHRVLWDIRTLIPTLFGSQPDKGIRFLEVLL